MFFFSKISQNFIPNRITRNIRKLLQDCKSLGFYFQHNPEIKINIFVAILKKDGDKLNFELVTGKPGVTWAVDGQSLNIAEPDFTNSVSYTHLTLPTKA